MLYFKLKKIFKLFNQYARRGINFLVRLFLAAVYFILILPFAVLTRLGADYLGLRRQAPCWVPLIKIEDEKELLIHQ